MKKLKMYKKPDVVFIECNVGMLGASSEALQNANDMFFEDALNW